MNTRLQRLMRENEVPDSALFTAGAMLFALVLVAAAIPAANSTERLAISPMEAQAATIAVEPARMPPPDARASEGNVVDMTY